MLIGVMKRAIFGVSIVALVAASGIFEAQARPQYAQKEGKQCGFCHVNPAGGGARNFRGFFYGANGLSLEHFDENREAMIAHVEPNAMGDDAVWKVGYISSVSTSADKAITQASNRAPVLVIFLPTTADDNAKTAAKLLNTCAGAFGRNVAVVGVVRGDVDAALKLTGDLDNNIRILSDADGAAATKLKAEQGFDMVYVPRFIPDDPAPMKNWQGFSKANLDEAIASVGGNFDKPDTSAAPAKAVRGPKLGG